MYHFEFLYDSVSFIVKHSPVTETVLVSLSLSFENLTFELGLKICQFNSGAQEHGNINRIFWRGPVKV
jgi:hypothetical protein